MKVGFYVNRLKPRADGAEAALRAAAAAAGFEVVEPDAAEVLIVLGGDGTLLRAAKAHVGQALVGFNLGGLGFLSSVVDARFDEALSLLAQGRYRVGTRTMLAVRRAGRAKAFRALNDVVAVREMTGRAARFDLTVNARAATRYLADGLVIATPTGSTAYSLSAGGPILFSDSRSFVVTPMNPHALGVRPFVVGDDARLAVTAQAREDGASEPVGVYADGERVFSLGAGETLEIVRAAESVRLVELEGYDPYDVLARKLGWTGSHVK